MISLVEVSGVHLSKKHVIDLSRKSKKGRANWEKRQRLLLVLRENRGRYYLRWADVEFVCGV